MVRWQVILPDEFTMLDQNSKETTRLSLSFLASLFLHALLFMLLGVMHVQQKNTPPMPRTMDVVMLDQKLEPSKTPPKDAKVMANRNAKGGDATAKDRVTRAAKAPPATKPHRRQPLPQPGQQPKPAVPANSIQTRLSKAAKRPSPKPKKRPTSKPVTKTPPRTPSLEELMPSAVDLAQISRRYERERRMKQLHAKEADIPINTRETKYAPYAQQLVRALEEQWRPGQADYNKFNEDQRRAVIRLTIEKNGDLGGVEILRPSPIPEINESAIKAIHDASPFRPLPRSWGLDRVSFYLTFEVINDRFVFRTM